jgi:predicted transposase YdaD
MIKHYDPTARNLIELGPAEWVEYLGNPGRDPAKVRVIDSNISTVTAEADKVIWVDDSEPWIQHIELQAGRDVKLEQRAHKYSTLLRARHDVPVRTALVLLRPVADGPELTGFFEQKYRNAEVYDWFRYDVVRVWQQPVDLLLASGLTVLPLAPVSDVKEENVPEVLMAISDRLKREASPEDAATLWSATQIMMGLRYRKEQIDSIIQRVSAMLFGIRGIEESSVYQWILKNGEAQGIAQGLSKGIAQGITQGITQGIAKGIAKGIAEGRIEEARELLLRQGRKKLGPPGETFEAEITAVADLDRLHELFDRIPDVSTWDELLSPPSPSA